MVVPCPFHAYQAFKPHATRMAMYSIFFDMSAICFCCSSICFCCFFSRPSTSLCQLLTRWYDQENIKCKFLSPPILFLLNELPDVTGLDLFVRFCVLGQLCHRLHVVFQPGQVHRTFQNKMFDKSNVGQLVFQPGQINRTFWVLVPCFRVNPSVEKCVSIKYLSKFEIRYPRSSKKARWADSPLKARVCSRLKPRMAWLFTYQSSCLSASHQTIHCLEKRVASPLPLALTQRAT